eukprot:TRINITY_DN58583_c0_g1_i1.p1 TRINITY_DN58583_c0_g1~~TRINITY_DN58583_c0_g1_i1.p1  ORF type:complete len:156 (+),score=12.68 TRINITY_DN58583_c0_g1_i1:88-555(+)
MARKRRRSPSYSDYSSEAPRKRRSSKKKHSDRKKKAPRKKARKTRRRSRSYSYSYYSDSRSRSRSRSRGRSKGMDAETKRAIEKFCEFNELNPEVAQRLRNAHPQVQKGVLRDGDNVKDNARNPNGVVIQRVRKHEIELGLGHGGPPKKRDGGGY